MGKLESATGPAGPVRSMALLLLVASQPVWALNADDSLLQEFIVDASTGDLGNGEAASLLGRLNQFDLASYSLTFSDGTTVSLNQDSASLDRQLQALENRGADLTAIVGPSGSLAFGGDGTTCVQGSGSVPSNLESNVTGAADQCLGVILFQDSEAARMAAAGAQMATVDLRLARPITQLLNDVRRFVGPGQSPAGPENAGDSGGASGDEPSFSERWGVYLNSGGNFGRIESAPNRLGFGTDSQFVTTGADYRFSKSLVGGFLFNYTGTQSRFAGGGGGLNADIYRFTPFVSITPFDNAFIDLMAGYSYQSFSSHRGGGGTEARASYSADQAMAAMNLGYTYWMDALSLTGYGGAGYISSDVGGYGEKGTGTLVNVGGFSASTWTTTLGTELAYSYSTSFGVLRPHLKLEWVHAYSGNAQTLTLTVPGQGLVMPIHTSRLVEDWGNISTGMQALLGHGLSGFINYEAQVMSIGYNHRLEGGVRWEF